MDGPLVRDGNDSDSIAVMTTYTIAVIGGTGPQGKGLAYRWARHGHTVVIGSRAAEKAAGAASEVAERIAAEGGTGVVTGATNAEAAAVGRRGRAGGAVGRPRRAGRHLLPLAGKTVISCVNPLGFDKRGAFGLAVDGGESSAAESAARIAPEAAVVGAFHHVSAVSLWSEAEFLDHEDVLVCGDSAEAKEVAIALAEAVAGAPASTPASSAWPASSSPSPPYSSRSTKYKVRSGVRVAGLG